MEHAFGGTFIATDGTNLNLAGVTFGRFNVFTERAPLQAHGTFRLIRTIGSASLLLEPTSNKVTRKQHHLRGRYQQQYQHPEYLRRASNGPLLRLRLAFQRAIGEASNYADRQALPGAAH